MRDARGEDGFAIETWPDQSQFIGEFSRGKKSGSGVRPGRIETGLQETFVDSCV